MIQMTSTGTGCDNPGIVPPWMQGVPLPDPVGDDTPRILPISDDEWEHRTFVLHRIAELEFTCDEGIQHGNEVGQRYERACRAQSPDDE